jgi:hypothetical protein
LHGVQREENFTARAYEMLPGTAELRRAWLNGNDGPGPGIDIREEAALNYPPQPGVRSGLTFILRAI